ncbi:MULTISPECIES: hypothetical protein [unclassified Plantactinospora]|uniref:hypothetical protein n=1 Tax=unclassified Plantactinospora TaxID=2631981 RepID=UPI000D162C1D|nr:MULTISPECIES: hypothetical protein [unclassified Plantactinospora]AVT29775.1 hypothetical protein C6361_10070 [Plantactinospora sp. BC1]AVT36281.1 hypothetical protein C6W10_07170 [Plantactinospora sp. BB1]
MPRPSIAWPARSLAVLGIVAVTAGAVGTPATANPLKSADVTVTVEAPRNILPTGGWSSVSAVVRNVGALPARGARVRLTLPAPFQASELSTSSDWDCEFVAPAGADCVYLRELAPHAEAYPVRLAVGLYGGTVGQPLTGRATVSTPREGNTGNNTDEQVFTIVGEGLIQGVFWHDVNADGVRGTGEPIVDPTQYSVRSVDDEDSYGWSNSFGPYRIQVPAKRYYVEVQVSKSKWRFTRPNVGSDATDSDLVPYSETTYYQYGRFGPFTVDVNRPTVIDVGLVSAS